MLDICKQCGYVKWAAFGCWGHEKPAIHASNSLADKLFNGQLKSLAKLGWMPDPTVPDSCMHQIKDIMDYWSKGPGEMTLTMRIDFKNQETVLIDMTDLDGRKDAMEAFRIIKAYWDEGYYRD